MSSLAAMPVRTLLNHRKLAQVLAATIGVFLICLPLRSQVNTGRISGTVTDQTGGAISGAKVTVIDVARGENRELVADAAGQYAAPNLTPGIYTVRAEFMGFQTVNRENVEVGVGADIRVDITLQPGAQNQTVTVTEALPIMNTTNAQTGGTLENQILSNIPLNGRNYRWLAAFVPGVMLTPGEGVASTSTYGGGTYGGTFLVDGLYQQAIFTLESNVGGASEAGDTTLLPLDAIQEINLVANANAEYGWAPGLTMSVGLKSGTNAMHGSAYAYGRDQDLDAKNPFAATRSPVEFEQWGATLGGPIKKNKLFYFLGYESERSSIASTFTESSPTTASLAGNTTNSIPDAIAGIINTPGEGAAALSQLSLNLAGCNYQTIKGITGPTTGAAIAASCAENQYGFPSLFNNFSSTSTTVANTFLNHGGSDNGLWKLDYHINDHHTLSGSYFYGKYLEYAVPNSTIITQQYWQDLLSVTSQMVRAVEIWTPNSSLVNEARVGYDRSYRPVTRAECSGNGNTSNPLALVAQGAQYGADGGPNYEADYGLYSGAPACGMPTVTIAGFTGQLGFANNRDDLDSDTQGADTLSYTRGKHQFKFGTDIRAEQLTGSKVLDAQTGVLAFGASGDAAFSNATALESFLAGVPSSESIKYGNPIRNVGWDQIALFAQDDWRALPKLTLNLGLRWEMQTPISDANGLLGNFDPAAPTGMIQNNHMWNTLSDFEPRLGLVWDVTGHGTTVVRSGGGITYETPQLLGLMSVQNDDYSSEPTGATLYNANGTTIQGPGNINNSFVTKTPITSGGVAVGNFIPWVAGSDLFTAPASESCGNGLQVPGSSPAVYNPSPCIGYGGNPNLKFPQVITWNLTVEHAFTNNISLNVGYVGSHASSMMDYIDANEPTPGVAGSSAELLRRPYEAQFPWFSKIELAENVGSNNYDGLEMNLTERASHGLTFSGNYTLSHALGFPGAGSLVLVPNSLDPKGNYGNMPLDARNHFTFTASYDVPGRKAPGQMLEGWALNASVNILSALPVNVADTKFDTSGTGEGVDRWNLYGSASAFNKAMGGAGTIPCYGVSGSVPSLTGSGTVKSSFAGTTGCITVAPGSSGVLGSAALVSNMPAACVTAAENEATNPTVPSTNNGFNGLAQLYTIGCYFVNGSAIVPPAQGTYGNMTYDELRGKGAGLLNGSVTKDWKIKERVTAQFRVEVFNLLNRTQYASIGVNLGSPSTFGLAQSTPDVAKGNPVVGSGGPRAIQLGLKFLF